MLPAMGLLLCAMLATLGSIAMLIGMSLDKVENTGARAFSIITMLACWAFALVMALDLMSAASTFTN